VPQGEIETVIGGFIDQAQHAAKTFTFDTEGHIYVNIGAPSNACQGESRTAGAPGLDPCPQLDLQSGIWQFDADKLGQVHGQDGKRYNTGVRNAMALDWNHEDDTLYFATHGRDQLSGLWPEIYSHDDNTEMPAESFFRAEEGLDAGWPYTFFDPQSNQRFKAPEYGGKHKELAEAGKYKDPDIAFPAHWAPNDLVFYDHKTFPKHYHGGAFLAFQGSWNRAPNPQAGYNVVFIPFRDGRPTGEYQIFADGFEGDVPVMSPRDALYRPCGVAVGPDGALYISDIIRGRIWKVTYQN
jgi:glucose/arabinose dehydrogenase